MGTLTLRAEHLEGMHHRATIEGFTIEADEPPTLGGTDAHPKPLDYLNAALAFCTLTQLKLLAPRLDVVLDEATCSVESDWSSSGSVRLGTNRASCDQIRVTTTIESRSDPERVAELIERAEAACYAMAALREPVDVVAETIVNGAPHVAPGSSPSAI